MKKRGKSLKIISIFQIFLLISFTFAFSFILSSELRVVSASGCNDLIGHRGIQNWTTAEDGSCIPAGGSGGTGAVSESSSTSFPTSSIPGGTAIAVAGLGVGNLVRAESGAAFLDQGGKVVELTAEQAASANVEGVWAGLGVGFLGGIAQGFVHAGIVIAGIRILSVFGVEEEIVNGLSISAAAGIITARALAGASQQFSSFSFFGESGWLGLQQSTWVGIGVGALVFALVYKKERQETITFSCLPWQAPVGGADCEVCNNLDFPCSEYQCRSLGQACELINQGTNEERCVWVNSNDVNPPVISPWVDALLNDFSYTPDNAVSPPDRGVQIHYDLSEDNCVPAFTPLRLGVESDEPARCKIDVLRKDNFDNMDLFMSSGLLRYNHSYALTLPSPESLGMENITIENNGNFELHVRCQDANGNSNVGNFQFKYCVDQGPDTTPPLIVTTSILDGSPILFNQDSVDLDLFVNEPSECRWDHNDRGYDVMENDMACASGVFEYNAQMLYRCGTTLTGLNDRTENDFYFRCKDKPGAEESDRNVNTESYEFTLIGTQPLVIDSVSPENGTELSDSTGSVRVDLEVRTSAGYRNGESACYYNDLNSAGNDFISFFETDSFQHTQELFLSEGNYEYAIRCIDLGGNADTEVISFEVDTDTEAPTIVRAYKEDNFLKLVTDEEARCVYSTFGCSYDFEEGTSLTVSGENNHFVEWNNPNSNLYVKCEDSFGNRPAPNQCSMTVRASDF